MVICAAVHGQTASKTNIVSVADAPFPPRRAFAYVKEAQKDTLHDAHALGAPRIVWKGREFRNTHIRWKAASAGDVPAATPEIPARPP